MKKALLTASVLIGAFLFQPAYASPEYCPLGGDLQDGTCTMPAPNKQQWGVRYGNNPFFATGLTPMEACLNGFAHMAAVWQQSNSIAFDIIRTNTTLDNNFLTCNHQFTYKYVANGVTYIAPSSLSADYRSAGFAYQCPPDGFPQFELGPFQPESGGNFCYYLAATPENDDDDCPEGTIGGCTPPEPDCLIAGNGMEVCREDPNNKCQVSEVNGQPSYYNCESGCGFVNDQFLCSTEPDSDGEIPDLSNCFKVGNSWACPSEPPLPNDNINNPQKPLPDMTKGDFKDTNIGIETRLDANNSLLSDLSATGELTAKGIQDLNAKSLAANGILNDIRRNTGATAGNTKDILDLLTENSEGDPLDLETNYVDAFKSGFGITGDESLDDLTNTEITLDQFRNDFQWSTGGSQCPQPRAINIIGKTFYMDWQPFCTAFNVIGYFILAAAYFLSIRIAFGGRS